MENMYSCNAIQMLWQAKPLRFFAMLNTPIAIAIAP